ncbi:MAG: 50S ribosomal protein L23 [Planctomycetota bacterium]
MKDPYTIIVSPHITEKATERLDDHGVYVFKVARDANKIEIKAAVEDIFDVKVKNVNVSNQRGRRKRIGRSVGFTTGFKKAVVTLNPGHKIDVL